MRRNCPSHELEVVRRVEDPWVVCGADGKPEGREDVVDEGVDNRVFEARAG
jgi:hypothetical protein